LNKQGTDGFQSAFWDPWGRVLLDRYRTGGFGCKSQPGCRASVNRKTACRNKAAGWSGLTLLGNSKEYLSGPRWKNLDLCPRPIFEAAEVAQKLPSNASTIRLGKNCAWHPADPHFTHANRSQTGRGNQSCPVLPAALEYPPTAPGGRWPGRRDGRHPRFCWKDAGRNPRRNGPWKHHHRDSRSRGIDHTGSSRHAEHFAAIRKALENIDQKRYFLPAIQREFVWAANQIEQLFDSVCSHHLKWFSRWARVPLVRMNRSLQNICQGVRVELRRL